MIGRYCFRNKNYCAVLSRRVDRILLALAAVEGWTIYQTDIVQAFLHRILEGVDLYLNALASYPCPIGYLLKLLRVIYCLHLAHVKFKQEVIDWLKTNLYIAANDAQTIWIKLTKHGLVIHAIYADDFLHFTNNKAMYQDFQKQFKKRFEVKTGSVGIYLGNQIKVDEAKFTVELNQSYYIDELLNRFQNDELAAVKHLTVFRDLMSWGSSTLSLGTGVLKIGPTFCGDSLIQIGLDVQTVDC